MNKTTYTLLSWCGVICCICGLIIVVTAIINSPDVSDFTIYLGAINLINGVLFLWLSRNHKSDK